MVDGETLDPRLVFVDDGILFIGDCVLGCVVRDWLVGVLGEYVITGCVVRD